MTTAAKPLPDHGTEARYKGNSTRPPCRCRRCVTGWTRAGQKRHLLRLAGKPASLTPPEVARVLAHIHTCQDTGMSQCLIARKAGVAQSTISRLLSNPGVTCLRQQGERILAVQPGDFDQRADRPATGTIRRVRALYFTAHGPASITRHADLSLTMVTEIAGAEYKTVSASTEETVRAACVALAGITGTCRSARVRAIREGWAPLGAWDEIDDPEALPEFTGHCGTNRGWWIHSIEKIPGCERCDAAHTEWKAAHAHLTGPERASAMGKARAAASGREAGLAEDARELMRLGEHVEQAAARLGVTRQHLQQAMVRHPERAEQELAA